MVGSAFVQRPGRAAQHAEVAGGKLKRDRQAVGFLAGVHPLDGVTGQQHGRLGRGVGAGEAGDLLGGDAAQRLGPLRRTRLASVPAQHIRLKLLEAGAVGRDEGAIDAVLRQQDMQDRQHQGGIGPGAAGDPPGVGLARRARAPRVDDHDLGAAAGGFEQAGVDVGAQARFQHVGAPQDDHLGILHRGGIETGGHPLIAEEIRQDELDCADAVGAGEAGGAAVEVQETAQQRDGAVERAGAAGAGQVQHRGRAVLRPDVPQPVGDQVQRLVPTRLAEAAGAARAGADQRPEHPIGGIELQGHVIAPVASEQILPGRHVVGHVRDAPVFERRRQRARVAAAILAAEHRDGLHHSTRSAASPP